MKKRILCLGDSNTWGYNPENGDRYDEQERWTGILQERLGNEYVIIEEGMNGRTTAFVDRIEPGVCALDYIYSCLISQFPLDYIVIMLGTNDVKDRYHVKPMEISYGLDELMIRIKETCKRKNQNPRIIIVSPASLAWKKEWIEFSDASVKKINGLAEEYKAVALQYNAVFMNANEVIKNHGVGCDGIHFSREGHRRLAEKIEKVVKKGAYQIDIFIDEWNVNDE